MLVLMHHSILSNLICGYRRLLVLVTINGMCCFLNHRSQAIQFFILKPFNVTKIHSNLVFMSHTSHQNANHPINNIFCTILLPFTHALIIFIEALCISSHLLNILPSMPIQSFKLPCILLVSLIISIPILIYMYLVDLTVPCELAPCSTMYVFLEYPSQHSSFHCHYPNYKKIILSCLLVFSPPMKQISFSAFQIWSLNNKNFRLYCSFHFVHVLRENMHSTFNSVHVLIEKGPTMQLLETT